jgi:hypothetical protein
VAISRVYALDAARRQDRERDGIGRGGRVVFLEAPVFLALGVCVCVGRLNMGYGFGGFSQGLRRKACGGLQLEQGSRVLLRGWGWGVRVASASH